MRPLYSWALPSVPMRRSPSGDSGVILSRIERIVGTRPGFSSSSQWAPSKTGVETQTAGSVIGRVLVSAVGGFEPGVGTSHP